MTGDEVKSLIGCSIAGGMLMYNAIRKMRVQRRISDTPRSKIASAPQGFIEVQGFAWPKEKTIPAANGREAVYYSLSVERLETRGSGKNRRKEWVLVFNQVEAHPFYIVDPTGLAEVDIAGCTLELDSSATTAWNKVSGKDKERILEKVGNSISGFPPSDFLWGLFSSSYRVVQNEIYVGSPLYLMGDFRTGSQQKRAVKPSGLGNFSKKVFDLQSRSQRNVSSLLDKNKDGKISHEEAQEGYAIAASIARRKQNEVDDTEFEIFGTMGSSSEHKLMVADAHEEHLVKRMGQWVVPSFAFGALLLALGIGQFFFKDFSKNTAIHREVAAIQQVDPADLHQQCISGQKKSCLSLLRQKMEFSLTEQQVVYYTQRACQLGETSQCGH